MGYSDLTQQVRTERQLQYQSIAHGWWQEIW